MEWPEHADASLGNLAAIEEFLRQYVIDAHVTLLGEIDLVIAVEYAGIDWSMAQLANFGFGKFRSRASFSAGLAVLYPATIAIWAVNRAQNFETGTELWANSGLSDSDNVKLALAFSTSINVLGLENFKRELRYEPNQRHVNLARMHAIIPTYALTKFAAYIRGGVSYHRQPARVMQSILEATDIAKPVQRLFEFQPHLGNDLIDRCMKTMRDGNRFGLPPRITKVLLDDPIVKDIDSSRGLDVPSIFFDPASGEMYANGYSGWQLSSDFADDPNPDDIPNATIVASRDGDRGNVILDPTKGYLLFDQDMRLIEQRSIPASGAYLIWDKGITFDTSVLVNDVPQRMGKKWRDWSWGWCRVADGIELHLTDGKIVFLGTAPDIKIESKPVPNVIWSQQNKKVFGTSPYFQPGQHASVVDNRSNAASRKLSHEGENLCDLKDQLFDLTVFAGLGRSKTETGLYLPGFDMVGNHSPLRMDESRIFKVVVPEGWNPCEDLVISGKEAHDLDSGMPAGKKFQIFKSSESVVNLVYVPSVINWTIEFDGQELETLHETVAHKYEMLQKIQKIVVHGYSAEDPTIFAIDGDAKPQPFKGTSRDHDAVFDLRSLRSSMRKQKLDLNLTINSQRTTLVSFYPKTKSVHIGDLRDLRAAVDEKGWFTDEQWREIDIDRQKQNFLNRKINRYGKRKW
jgi:hypothetical protein